ncbi:MAG: hypothetical protein IKC64_02085, partial [Clostridia bacterium]|nr:hypothetical protein [Clostridia bacterium]
CYHLSMDKGRFIAGLTLVSAVTGIDASKVAWFPSTISDYDKAVAIESVTNAIAEPLKITRSKL